MILQIQRNKKWGAKIQHPESVLQGLSTVIGVADLRSKRGEFQHKTTQSLRRCTGAVPAVTASDGSTNLIPGWAHGPRPGNRPAQKWCRENHLSDIQGLG